MNKPYIICHMMASVDGRIDCDMTEKIESGDEYYEALDELNVTTTVSGRVTAELHYALPGVFEPKGGLRAVGREKVWKSVDAAGYSVVFDSKGTLLWEDCLLDDKPLICVVCENVSEEYLQYLQGKGISYIVVGKEHTDVRRAVELLAEQFGVERMAVVGGGKINGGFLSAGLLDEMSLMIAPGIDGRSSQPSVFDGVAADEDPVRLKLKSCKVYDCGTVWMRYEVKC